MNLSHAISSITEPMLGQAYAHNPCGDGPGSGIDERPFHNEDRSDCVTFIEASFSQYLANLGLGEVQDLQLALRYRQSQASFMSRLHNTRVEWISNALARGYLRDETVSTFGRTKLVRKQYRYDPAKWLIRAVRGRMFNTEDLLAQERMLIRLIGRAASLEPLQTSYLVAPLRDFASGKSQVQPARLFSEIIKLQKPKLVLFLGNKTDHLAWLLPHENRPILRHASREHGKVVDGDFSRFVRVHASVGYLTSLVLFGLREGFEVGQGPNTLKGHPR